MANQSLFSALGISPEVQAWIVMKGQEFREYFLAQRICKGTSLPIGPKAISLQSMTKCLVYHQSSRYRVEQNRARIGMDARSSGDLGWWNTFSLTDTQERTAAQEEIASLWKTWWARRGSRNENPVKLDPSGDR